MVICNVFPVFLQNLTQYERHLLADRQRQQQNRANETDEQRAARQLRDRMWHQQARARVAGERTLGTRTRRGRGGRVIIDLEKAGFSYDPASYDEWKEHEVWDIGKMDKVCTYCDAKKFKGEKPGMCCKSGKVNEDEGEVRRIPKPPDALLPLFDLSTTQGKQFVGNARKYNSAFQMSSILTQWEVLPGFMPTVKISGHMYHRIGGLNPSRGEEPKFLQIYFIGKILFSN